MSAFADRSSEQHKASQGCAPPVGFDLYQEHVAPRHPPRARPQRPRPPPTHRKAATARAPAALSPTKPGNFPSEPPKLRQQLNFRSTSPREFPSEQPRLRRILDFRLDAFLDGSFSNLPILLIRVRFFCEILTTLGGCFAACSWFRPVSNRYSHHLVDWGSPAALPERCQKSKFCHQPPLTVWRGSKRTRAQAEI